MKGERKKYMSPSLTTLSFWGAAVLCISGEGSFDEWVDDGEVTVTTNRNTWAI